jgi:hypothetical protein
MASLSLESTESPTWYRKVSHAECQRSDLLAECYMSGGAAPVAVPFPLACIDTWLRQAHPDTIAAEELFQVINVSSGRRYKCPRGAYEQHC